MNKSILFYTIGILLLSILSACTSDNTAEVTGGGGIEGEAFIEGIVRDNSGRPKQGVQLKLIDLSEWYTSVLYGEDPVKETLISSESGHYRFMVESPGKYNIIAEDDSLKALISKDVNLENVIKEDTITLKESGSLSGSIIFDNTIENPEIHVFGTMYKTSVSNSGDFSFSSLPEGSHLIISSFQMDTEGMFSIMGNQAIESGSDLTMDSIGINSNTLLIDDFEGELPLTAAGHITGGTWYTFSDSDDSGNSVSDMEILQSGNQEKGDIVRISITLRPGREYPYSGAGFFIRNGYSDLSYLNKITFQAKGEGDIRVEVADSLTKALGLDRRLGYNLQLTDNWTEYEIPTDSFTLEDSPEQDIDWSDISNKVATIQFIFQTYMGNQLDYPYHLDLNDIKLNGITIDDLMQE